MNWKGKRFTDSELISKWKRPSGKRSYAKDNKICQYGNYWTCIQRTAQYRFRTSKLLRHSTKLERRMAPLSSKAFKLPPRKDGRETGRPWNKINHIVEIFRFYKSASKRQAMKTKLGGNDPGKQSTEQGILLRRINWMWSSQLANKRPARLLFA